MEQSPRRLVGKTAIVTGASRGLGQLIAQLFAREGANVVVAARTEEQFDARLPGSVHTTVDAIRAAGGEAIAVRCDVADDDDRVGLIERAHEAFGAVDILVNNAALTVPGRPGKALPTNPLGPLPSFVDFPVKAYRMHFETGVFAAYRLMQLVLPEMIARRQGAIVNISSNAAHVPPEGPYAADAAETTEPILAGYGGNKLVLEHLTRCVAFEVAPYSIAVNALLPSVALRSPGLDLLGGYEAHDPSDFAEATLLLATADPAVRTGTTVFHHDLLDAAHPARGWHGS